MKRLFEYFRELYSKVHMPLWGHTHTWEHKEKQVESIKLTFTVSVVRYNPELRLLDRGLTVYDLPKELAELNRVLEAKLAQPAAPHTHKIFSTFGNSEKDEVYFTSAGTWSIGDVKKMN